VIDNAKRLPEARIWSKPDSRILEVGQEHILSFESEITKLNSLTASANFEISLDQVEAGKFRLAVELVRKKQLIWGQARLRREPSQMKMPLVSDEQLPLIFETNPDIK